MLMNVLDSIRALSNEVTNLTPTYDTFVADTRCSENRVKKHILGWPSRQQVRVRSGALFAALKDLQFRQVTWNATPKLKDEEEPATEIKECRNDASYFFILFKQFRISI